MVKASESAKIQPKSRQHPSKSKAKTAKVWDYETQKEKEVTGFYINGKGKPGRDGDRTSYGSINPAKPANSSSNLKAEDIF